MYINMYITVSSCKRAKEYPTPLTLRDTVLLCLTWRHGYIKVWGGVAKGRVYVHVHRMGTLTLHDTTHTFIRASKKKKLGIAGCSTVGIPTVMKSCPKLQYIQCICSLVCDLRFG